MGQRPTKMMEAHKWRRDGCVVNLASKTSIKVLRKKIMKEKAELFPSPLSAFIHQREKSLSQGARKSPQEKRKATIGALPSAHQCLGA
jgi:hypothetical protein